MARRQSVTLYVIVAVALFFSLSLILSFRSGDDSNSGYSDYPLKDTFKLDKLDDSVLHGTATAPRLENATLKAELGRAAWRVLHTTMAKFPDAPTAEDSLALKSYIHLFARLYPCGDCARHFQTVLKKYPPQVRTRSTAAAWACHVHNVVNMRLGKEIFDCSKIGDFYDCGCADDDDDAKVGKGKKGKGGKEEFRPLELVKDEEGLTRGG